MNQRLTLALALGCWLSAAHAQTSPLPPPTTPPTAAPVLPATPAPSTAPVLPAALPAQVAQAQTLRDLGFTALSRGGHREARDAFEAALRLNFADPEAHYGLAQALYALNDLRGAAFEFAEFSRLAPTRVEGPFNLGVIALRQGDLPAAAAAFARADTLAANGPVEVRLQVLRALADVQYRTDPATAQAALVALAALEPGAEVLLRLAYATAAAQGPGAALPFAARALSAQPGSVPATLLLAEGYRAQGLPDRAARELQAGLPGARPEGAAQLNRALATLRLGLGDLPGALAAAGAAVAAQPRDPEAQRLLGALRLQTGDLNGAAAAYLAALRITDDAPGRAGLAAVRLAQGQASAARQNANLARTRAGEGGDVPSLARAEYVLGVLAYREGQPERAYDLLLASVNKLPDPLSLEWLAQAAYATGNLEVAVQALENVTEAEPTPERRLRYGAALLASGRYTSARDVLTALLRQDETLGEAWYHLGWAERALGDAAAATRAFAQARALNYEGANTP